MVNRNVLLVSICIYINTYVYIYTMYKKYIIFKAEMSVRDARPRTEENHN